MDLTGKTALVTGAAKRVGREIALELARRGADVLVHYRGSQQDAESTAADIRAMGRKSETFQADLASNKDLDRLTNSIHDKKWTVDVLVNSASLFFKTPVETATETDWDTLLDSNLKGPFFLSTQLGLQMIKQNGGVIINLVDWSAFRPYRDYAAYCSSKGGLVTLTKALARDLAPRVRVNAVAPGPVLQPPDMNEAEAKTVAGLTALGRWGTPQDVARAVAFLVENDYINGQILVVDGGRSIV
jgi:pteridine reductase